MNSLNINTLPKFIFVMVIIGLFSSMEKLQAQTFYYSLGGTSNVLSNTSDMVGVGTTSPNAKFHIRENSGFNYHIPLLKTELYNLDGRKLGSFEFLRTYNDSLVYGLYQTSFNGLTNYFQDDVIVGNTTIFSGRKDLTGIGIFGTSTFRFEMQLTELGVVRNPLTLFPDSVYSQYKFVTPLFRLTSGCGDGKILVSDARGNGNWTDATNFHDDDWLIGEYGGGIDPGTPGMKAAGKGTQFIYLNEKYKYVGIGTPTPQSELAVNGKITAKEVEVTLDGFPDSVFHENYKLNTLQEIEKYIQANKHLPGIPSEKEVKEQGLELGKMNALLLKKVEELTLYIIAMKKEIEQLKSEHSSK